jgi:deoxycytidine triphosphate deaminase
MATLSRKEIINRFNKKELIKNPRELTSGNDKSYDVEPASYDLAVGTIIKRRNSGIEKVSYDSRKRPEDQKEVTLEPGQILFIITMEDVAMPTDLCGTVYSKNNLALSGVLAWTTGHVDPGYCGPIIIRLINLRSTNYSIKPGKKIYTIVFNELKYSDRSELGKRKALTRDEAVQLVTESANSSLNNTLYDLALLTNFVKKEELGVTIVKWFTKKMWGWIIIAFTFATAVIALIGGILQILEFFKDKGK